MKSILKKAWAFLRENNEFWGIPIGIFIFIGGVLAIQALDPTAATFDAGILHALLFALAAFVFLKGVTWLFIYLDFPEVYKYLDKKLETEAPSSVWASLGIYLFYFGLLCALTIAIL